MFSNMNSHHLQPRPAATSTESTQHSSVGLTKKDSDGAYDLEKRYQMALQEAPPPKRRSQIDEHAHARSKLLSSWMKPERVLILATLAAVGLLTFAFDSLPGRQALTADSPVSRDEQTRLRMMQKAVKIMSREEVSTVKELKELRQQEVQDRISINQLQAQVEQLERTLREMHDDADASASSGAAKLAATVQASNSVPLVPAVLRGRGSNQTGVLPPEMREFALFDENGCSSGQLWNAHLQECEFMRSVPRLETITPKELEYYFNIGRPVIIKDLASQWRALSEWTPEKLKERFGDVTVNVQLGRSKRKDFETAQDLLRRDMPFAEFIDKSNADATPNDIYLTANNNLLHKPQMQGLFSDMQPFFPGFLYKDGPQTHFWYGAKSVVTPLHFDVVTLFHTHVRGRKLWHFWPPEDTPYMYHSANVYSSVDAYNVDHKKFPLFSKAHMFTETIGPGETIFLPTGWWHTVDNLDTPTITVSITSWVQQFLKYEYRLRKKWPMKTPRAPGPALPGEVTPKNFHISSWMRNIARSHQQHARGLPMTRLDWSDARRDDPDEFRAILKKYSEDNAERAQTILYMLMDPECSGLVFEWQAWIVENLGLNNAATGMVQVLGRDANPPALVAVRDMFKNCLARGPTIFEAEELELMAPKHDALMQRIRDNQRRLGKKIN
mmetsp:Transcript_12717/g.24126  ORF Transcript_12717/g.24126 Transcript_12717/m.24126 type:complete len:669 (-) Transcript_12717:335-2341(-)